MPHSTKIKGAWAVISKTVEEIVREMSSKKFGHEVGNLTVADISHHLTYECGIDSSVSAQLARGAWRRHEKWRFSDEARKLRAEFEAKVDGDTAK